MVSHKGAGWAEPENTLRSVQRAIDMGVDAVEVDVRRCRSGEPVLMHDSTVDRTTNGKGRVSSLTLSELKRLDAGKGEKVPTLEELLRELGTKTELVIEIKEPETVSDVLGLVKSSGMINRIRFCSFYHPALKRIKELSPASKCGALFLCETADPSVPARLALDANADSIATQRWFLTDRIVRAAHTRSIAVGAGPVNSADELAKVLKLEVDSISSDTPSLILDSLK